MVNQRSIRTVEELLNLWLQHEQFLVYGSSGGRILPRGYESRVERTSMEYLKTPHAQVGAYLMADRWYRRCWQEIRAVHVTGVASERDRRIARLFWRHIQRRLNKYPLIIEEDFGHADALSGLGIAEGRAAAMRIRKRVSK